MASDLTADMIRVMLRAVMKSVDEMPANEVNSVLLYQFKQTLQWLQARAEEIDNRSETKEIFSNAISRVSQMIDHTKGQTSKKSAVRTHSQVEPLNLAKLFEAWDRDFPGGSMAVLAQFQEINSRLENKANTSQVAKELTRRP